MKSFTILINKIVYIIGKCVRKGSSLPGKIALKLDPNILLKVQLPKNIIIVTGSNGKTSTTEMICNLFKKNGYNVGCNQEGSNQIEGVTTMVLNSCNLIGKTKKDVLIIEADERYLKKITKYIKPTYLVVTNLYRDQMTRNGHPEFIYDVIKDAIPEGTHLILNTDDPLSSLYGYKRDKVTYIGINKNDMDTANDTSVYNDAKYCPNCKQLLTYDFYHFSHIGGYKCSNCGHERKEPEFAITEIDLNKGEIKVNDKYAIHLNFKSIYNAYNILFSFAVAKLVGIDERNIEAVLDNYIMQNDRIQTFNINGMEGMLLTSKHENSISYNQSIQYVIRENKPCTVVIIVDSISRKYFTSETSWLWDIDFEKLNANCVKKIILAGKYVNDLAIRFNYTDIDKSKIIKDENLDKMMEDIEASNDQKIYVITCFADRMKFIKRNEN